MLSVPEAARQAEVSEGVIRAAIHAGELEAEKIGPAFAIAVDDLEEWMDSFLGDSEAEEDEDGGEE